LLRLKASNNATLDMGCDHTTAQGWLQVTDVSSLSTEYNLLLQPNGGNVGIGKTPASGYKLDIEANNQRFRLLGTTGFVIAEVQNDGGAFTMGKENSSGGGFYSTTGAYDSVLVSQGAVNMIFGTNNAERMRITSGGEVLISATTYSDGGNNISLQQGLLKIGSATTNGTVSMYFTNPNGVVGSVVTDGSNTQFNTSSDYRLKEDLQDFNGLDKVSKISVYDFKWKTDESRSYGVMAHELQEVLPDAVSGDKDAINEDESINPQGVDYSKIVPLLVKSIQELKAEVDLLKQECKCK